MHDKTACEIMDWATAANCLWWMKLVETDIFPCYEIIFCFDTPVTKYHVMIDTKWFETFSPLEVQKSSYTELLQFKKSPRLDGPWTNFIHRRDPTGFLNVINAPPKGQVHLIFTSRVEYTIARIHRDLHRRNAYIVRVPSQEHPLVVAESLRHLSFTKTIIIIHTSVKVLPIYSYCHYWHLNCQNKIIAL
jgi:hypothetical protein